MRMAREGQTILEVLALGTVPIVGAFVCVVLVLANRKIPNLNPAVTQATTILEEAHKPCQGSGADKADNCGTIALFNQDLVRGGDLITRADSITDKEGQLLDRSLPGLIAKADGALGGINRLTGAATGAALQASDSIQTVTQHVTPVLDASTAAVVTLDGQVKTNGDELHRAVADFDARVNSTQVDLALDGIATTSQNVALTTVQIDAIAVDLRKQVDRATAPQPWWKKALNYGNLGVNIACLATHSCPF